MNHSPLVSRSFFTTLAMISLLMLSTPAIAPAVEPDDGQSSLTASICTDHGAAQRPSWCTSAQSAKQPPHSVPEPAPWALISTGIASFSLATLWRHWRKR